MAQDHDHQLAVHTFTTKPWDIHECIENYARAGVGGISIWRETVAGCDLARVRKHVADAGLTGISLVRGGFFTGLSTDDRKQAIATNLAAIDECEALGLPYLVLVCGATPGQSPSTNREQIRDGIAAVATRAREAGVDLLIEPLHPIYAGDRSAICSLRDANDLCEQLATASVGLALDVYHVWHEMDLAQQIQRAQKNGWLRAYHICDFKPDQEHILLDRGLMGEGCIPLRQIDQWVRDAGFQGPREVEVFSRRWWSENQHRFLAAIVDAYRTIYRQ